MGTSTGYSAPPSWGPLKSDVTRVAGNGRVSTASAGQLIQDFIWHNGGASAMARGGGPRAVGVGGAGGGHGGGTVAGGRAARAVAGRLGGFISDVGRVGLDEALRGSGWADLVGRPVQEILAALLDRLGGQASTIDDVDARMALSCLQDKYFADAATAAELEQRLSGQVGQIEIILQDFFGFYLFEVFCRVFFERLVQRVGEARANSFLDQIGDFIKSTLANRAAGRDLSRINWAGSEGQEITSDIMETTLNVFGG
ncbi:MAG: hypothetical protein HYR84_03570 [Planctomycetes bacterium]|nr:hypothetical protein [Planctomycetota bacterium]